MEMLERDRSPEGPPAPAHDDLPKLGMDYLRRGGRGYLHRRSGTGAALFGPALNWRNDRAATASRLAGVSEELNG